MKTTPPPLQLQVVPKPHLQPALVQPPEGHAMQITFDGPLDVPKPGWQ